MTRQQAIDKIIATTQYSIGAATLFVDNLEALGLIKFDEPKKMDAIQIIAKELDKFQAAYKTFPICAAAPEIFVALKQAGYIKEQS